MNNKICEIEKPVRVAHVIGKMCSGGVESFVFNYYRYLDKQRYQFDFIYDEDSDVSPPKDIIAEGANFIPIPSYKHIFKYMFSLYKLFKTKHYLIVHSHMNTMSIFPLFVAWISKIPIRIAHSHSAIGGNEIVKNTLKRFLRNFSKVFSNYYFACSENAGRSLFGNNSFDTGKVIIIPNAIDYSKFFFKKNNTIEITSEIDQIIENIKYKFVIGHVGRFTYAKNHLFILKIFKEIKKRIPSSILILVGDGELNEDIHNMAQKLNIDKDIIFTGRTSSPELYYKMMDVSLLPSFYEGFAITAIEAQLSNLPIIISENVPDDVVISNACFQLSLSAGEKAWADKLIEIKDCQVILNDKAKEFDIKIKANTLCNQYDMLINNELK